MREEKYSLTISHISKLCLLADFYDKKSALREMREFLAKMEMGQFYPQNIQNLKFLCRVSNLVLSTQHNEDVFYLLRYFFNVFLEKNFDYDKEYNWYEIKSVLFFCHYLSAAKDFKDFSQRILNPIFHQTIQKYLKADVCLWQKNVMQKKTTPMP
ncbi:MAG: hypothetical protein MUE85_17780 [Microscillaceae bacterium]|jgi:hypothetical protein|nr:hypothetical protein [Microscillaceae bacterium]